MQYALKNLNVSIIFFLLKLKFYELLIKIHYIKVYINIYN